MPVIGSNAAQETEYVGSYGLGNIFLGSNLIQGGATPYSPFIRAEGGIITTSGNYMIHTFTTLGSATFNVLQSGSGANNIIEYLVVGGGAQGGLADGANSFSWGSGGGGAGGFLTGSVTPQLGNLSITIGRGGFYTIDPPFSTQTYYSSSLSQITASWASVIAYGGGMGGGYDIQTAGFDGASGGGGYNAAAGAGFAGGSAIYGAQGNNGGTANGGGTSIGSGGGGGGASQVGGTSFTSPTFTTAGAGGSGSLSSISGTPTYYAGGGGGGSMLNGASGGPGGGGGGGNSVTFDGTNATGYGSGGGGARRFGRSGFGSNGIVILRYPFQ